MVNEFKEVRMGWRVDQVECGGSMTMVMSYGKVYVVGKMGQVVYKSWTQVVTHEEIRDMKVSEGSCLFLNRKGQMYVYGEIRGGGGGNDRMFVEVPKEIEQISSISSIFSTGSGYFAVS